MKFTLIATTWGASRLFELNRLLRSLALQEVPVQFILVWQDPVEPDCSLATLLDEVGAEIVPAKRCSLSHARNLGLARATADVVAFPDDDCWYPPALLRAVADALSTHGSDGICTAVSDPLTGEVLGKRPVGVVQPVSFRNCLRLPVSVGIFVRFDPADASLYRFDERLGAGCVWGSGEESEFVFRLLKAGRRFVYDGTLEVHHPVVRHRSLRDLRKAYSYGLGFGVVVGHLTAQGVRSHLGFYVEMLFRSAAGAGIAAARFDTASCRVYLARFLGMVAGLVPGILSSRQPRMTV